MTDPTGQAYVHVNGPRAIALSQLGATRRLVQQNALSITGFYRLYVAKGEQVDTANHSAVEGLADCFRAGGRPAIDACLSIVRGRLTTGRYEPGPVADWLTDLAAATDGW